jgi:hypothetical protein
VELRIEHCQSVSLIAWLAEADAIQHHGRVRAEHRQIREALPDGLRLGARHPLDIARDGFTVAGTFVHVRHLDRVRHADLRQQFTSPGGCGSQSQHGSG